jgi:hypothetical protein
MFRFPDAAEHEDVIEQPDGQLRVRLWFWNELATIYVTPGVRFEVWYSRTLGEGVVLPWPSGGPDDPS